MEKWEPVFRFQRCDNKDVPRHSRLGPCPAPEGPGGDARWEDRARRAEAEASAARTLSGAGHLINESMERELQQLQNSKSWKVTKPMRDFSRIFKKRKARKEEKAQHALRVGESPSEH